MTRLLAIIVMLVAAAELATQARAEATDDCFREGLERRIEGCTAH